ncbi:MAG: GNAT family N-acetyltransferase [Rhodothermales bacterium]
MRIRPERVEDVQPIRRINLDAFDTDAEANLVDVLRRSGIPLISLVAEDQGILVGHILFSPVTLEAASVPVAGLAPMAVVPPRQNEGIGSLLVEEGLRQCVEAGYAAVVVLGHPGYYPRFGFVVSTHYGITSEYDVPAEVFMVKELTAEALSGVQGVVRYHPVFNEL